MVVGKFKTSLSFCDWQLILLVSKSYLALCTTTAREAVIRTSCISLYYNAQFMYFNRHWLSSDCKLKYKGDPDSQLDHPHCFAHGISTPHYICSRRCHGTRRWAFDTHEHTLP